MSRPEPADADFHPAAGSPSAHASSADGIVRSSARVLEQAGVPSPRVDAVALLAHAWGCSISGVERHCILREPVPASVAEKFDRLVGERAQRVPLQHLTGTAGFRRLTLQVGPGVFVPRPETEDVAGAAIAAAQAVAQLGLSPIVVDLCTGSGAIAASVASEVPSASVVAVEVSEDAIAWAQRNLHALGLAERVQLVHGDACSFSAWGPWAGSCDVVVSNPPYIPPGAVPRDPEVRDHDPHMALYGGGDDGLQIPLAVASAAAQLCIVGAVFIMEHADCQQEQLLQRLRADERWEQVRGFTDAAGRPRWVTAVRSSMDAWARAYIVDPV